MATKEDILKALSTIIDPESKKDIVSANMVAGLRIRGNHAGFAFEIGAQGQPDIYEPIRQQAEQTLLSLPGIERATIAMTSEMSGGAQMSKNGQ